MRSLLFGLLFSLTGCDVVGDITTEEWLDSFQGIWKTDQEDGDVLHFVRDGDAVRGVLFAEGPAPFLPYKKNRDLAHYSIVPNGEFDSANGILPVKLTISGLYSVGTYVGCEGFFEDGTMFGDTPTSADEIRKIGDLCKPDEKTLTASLRNDAENEDEFSPLLVFDDGTELGFGFIRELTEEEASTALEVWFSLGARADQNRMKIEQMAAPYQVEEEASAGVGMPGSGTMAASKETSVAASKTPSPVSGDSGLSAPASGMRDTGEARCVVRNVLQGTEYAGQCQFIPAGDGSFQLLAADGSDNILGFMTMRVIVTGAGVGELWMDELSARASEISGGAVTRSSTDSACWENTSYSVCAY